MLLSTSIPLAIQNVPPQARIVSLYATAHNPFTNTLCRVQVEGIRLVRDITPDTFLIADVREPLAVLGYGVRFKDLSHLSAFVEMEI